MYFQESFQDNVLHVVGVQGDLNGHHTQEAPPLFDGEFYAVQSPQSGDEEGISVLQPGISFHDLQHLGKDLRVVLGFGVCSATEVQILVHINPVHLDESHSSLLKIRIVCMDQFSYCFHFFMTPLECLTDAHG